MTDRPTLLTDIKDSHLVPHRAPVRRDRKSVLDLFELLDSRGVTDADFKTLFVRCNCGLITTRRAFRKHNCQEVVIDLTEDD